MANNMSIDLFPSKINSVTASSHPKFLKLFRIISLVTIAILAGIYISILGARFNIIGFWLIIFAFIFEALAITVELTRVSWLDKTASLTFIIVWPISIVFVVFFIWMHIYIGIFPLYILLSIVAWLVLVVDFSLNKVNFVRIQYIFVAVIAAFFIFYWLDDVKGILKNFSVYVEWIVKIGMFLSVFILLEASRYTKSKCCEKNEAYQPLI